MTKAQQLNNNSINLFNKPKVNLKEEFTKLRTQEKIIKRKRESSPEPDAVRSIHSNTYSNKLSNTHSKPLEYNKLFIRYLGDIESITGIPISTRQKELIKKAIESNKYTKLSKEDAMIHRKEYSSKRKELIAEWEKETGREFPKYDKPVYSKNGKIVRNVGMTYDLHHIILCSYGGDNKWFNFVPAKFPSEHQNGIHRKGGYCDKIFGGGD
jgi:hypothetical protein